MAALPGVDGFIDDDEMTGQMPANNAKNEENILLHDLAQQEADLEIKNTIISLGK